MNATLPVCAGPCVHCGQVVTSYVDEKGMVKIETTRGWICRNCARPRPTRPHQPLRKRGPRK